MTAMHPILLMPPRTVELRLAARWQLAMRHPLRFMEHFVFTNRMFPDPEHPTRSLNRVEPAPVHKPLIRHLTNLWLTHREMVILKPRQVWITWWMATLLVWSALASEYQLLVGQDKREKDVIGNEETGVGLLGKAKFILAHIPEAKRLGVWVEVTTTEIVFPRQHSVIMGIPQGGDIIRGKTATGVASDEAAMQEEFEQAFTAASACVRAGGWFLAVSTAGLVDGGFFRRLVQDLPDTQTQA